MPAGPHSHPFHLAVARIVGYSLLMHGVHGLQEKSNTPKSKTWLHRSRRERKAERRELHRATPAARRRDGLRRQQGFAACGVRVQTPPTTSSKRKPICRQNTRGHSEPPALNGGEGNKPKGMLKETWNGFSALPVWFFSPGLSADAAEDDRKNYRSKKLRKRRFR